MRQRIAWLLTVRSQDEDERQRGLMVMVIALGLSATSLLLLPLTLQPTSALSGRFIILGAMLVELGVFFLARYGRVTLGASTIIIVVMVATLSPILSSGTASFSVFYLALSLLIASLTLRPWQIWLVLLANLLGIALIVNILPISPLADQTSWNMLVGGAIFLGIVGLINYLGANSRARVLPNVHQVRTQGEVSA